MEKIIIESAWRRLIKIGFFGFIAIFLIIIPWMYGLVKIIKLLAPICKAIV